MALRDRVEALIKSGLRNEVGIGPITTEVLAMTQRAARDDARAFVDFVLRHTWPERAKAHGADAVHDIIKHHPFAKENGSPEVTPGEE
jgi:hypothetical protein